MGQRTSLVATAPCLRHLMTLGLLFVPIALAQLPTEPSTTSIPSANQTGASTAGPSAFSASQSTSSFATSTFDVSSLSSTLPVQSVVVYDHNPACNLGSLGPLAIGDSITFCVFLSTAKSKKMVFRIKVDDYSEMLLQNSSDVSLRNQTPPIYTWVTASMSQVALPLDCSNPTDMSQRSSVASCPQVYADSNNLAQMLSLVVNMQNGLVSSFAWDNNCMGCGSSSCMYSRSGFNLTSRQAIGDTFSEGTCGQSRDNCMSNSLSCDLKIFVTWAGTDMQNQHLVSAGLRLSQFTGYTLTSLYDSMNQDYGKVIQR